MKALINWGIVLCILMLIGYCAEDRSETEVLDPTEKGGPIQSGSKAEVGNGTATGTRKIRVLGYYDYQAQPGDTYNGLSERFTTLRWMILEANGQQMGAGLRPGQKIRIPLVEWFSYEGWASWYGPGFHGRRMASGDIYDQDEILIAHRHYPFNLEVEVTNLNNGRVVRARVRDRGPYVDEARRQVDLSRGAAKALGAIEAGVIPIRIRPLNTHLRKFPGMT